MSLASTKARAAQLQAGFMQMGAEPVECPILLPAQTLLDLYGEDIRARAYTAQDPVRGEVMLRPDFTVPVVQQHMSEGAEPARYTYAGEVFRRQEDHPERASEYIQVGYEIFERRDTAMVDAELFASFSRILSGRGLRAMTGDLGIVTQAVQGLQTSAAQRAALMRHIWRPKRFAALLNRYSGRTPMPESRHALLQATDPLAGSGEAIGLRSGAEIRARIKALREDTSTPALSGNEVDLLLAILNVCETCPNALERLRDIAVDMPAISPAVERLARRLDAMADQGMDIESLDFDAGFGRASMEYYDGFVFGFANPQRPDWPLVASGGRYDALTRQLGQGREIPAVGGVIRAGLLVEMEI